MLTLKKKTINKIYISPLCMKFMIAIGENSITLIYNLI